ncbi:MAG: hypothetical protein ACI85K_001235, partial [Hyphomicrobiaceae bacterium]
MHQLLQRLSLDQEPRSSVHLNLPSAASTNASATASRAACFLVR